MKNLQTVQPSTLASLNWQPRPVLLLLFANFMLLGLTIGSQGVLWAEVIAALQLTPGVFGSAQLVSPLVSVVLLLLGGRIAAAWGKQRMAVTSLFLLGLGSLALALTNQLWGLVGGLVILGLGNGFFETAMNGAAIDWEQAQGRSVLNRLHAGFSGGAVVGALGAGALLGAGWSFSQVFGLVAAVCGALCLASLLVRFPPVLEEPAASPNDLGATLRLLVSQRALLILAVLAMLGSMGESVANIWSVAALRERGADAMLGGTAFALLNGAMMIGRLANATLVDRWGARTSLLVSGGLLVVTTILWLIPAGVNVAILAFILLGLAVAGVVPTVLIAGAPLAPGQSGGLASGMLAAVYASFIFSPPLIGWLAELFSLQAALLTLGVAGVMTLWLARGLKT